jgi:hypothetical protein
VFPIGGSRKLSPYSANLVLYPERRSIRSSPDGCKTAILTVIYHYGAIAKVTTLDGTPPMVIESGTRAPAGALAGTCTFTW